MDRDRMHAVVNAWARAVAGNDAAALEAMVAPALREGVVQRARAVHGAFRDVAVDPVAIVVEGDAVAWRFRLRGRHVAALGGIAATERNVVLEGVNFQQVRDGIVVEHWTTVDLGPLRA